MTTTFEQIKEVVDRIQNATSKEEAEKAWAELERLNELEKEKITNEQRPSIRCR